MNLKICNENVSITCIINLLGIKIHKDLNFDTHIAKLSYKTTAQLNAVSILNRHLGKSEKTAVVNSFIYANLDYCSLV